MPALDKDTILVGGAAVIGVIVLVVFLFFIDAWVNMITWNFVMPYLFNLKTIGFGQALALSFLFNGMAVKLGAGSFMNRRK